MATIFGITFPNPLLPSPTISAQEISTPQYSSDSVRLIPIGDQNIVVKLGNQPLSPDAVIPLNETITVMFKILNNGTSPVTINALVIGSRGPGVNCENKNIEKWSAPDILFPTPRNITIQPGEEYQYEGRRAFYLPGTYFLEPIIQGPNGNWGGIQPFSCASINVGENQLFPTGTIPTPTKVFIQSAEAPTKMPNVIIRQVFSMMYPFEATNIHVEKGDRIEITVLGENPTWNCGRTDSIGPQGYSNEQYADTVYTQANPCALIGSISDSSPNGYFLVGAHTKFTASESGILFLGCNDSKDRFADNPSDSKLEVRVTVRKGLNIIPVIIAFVAFMFAGFGLLLLRKRIPQKKNTIMDKNRLSVFICYSSFDKLTVTKLYKKLRKEEWIDPWLDAEKLLPGENWDTEIRKAVKASGCVIVCLSRGSTGKEGYVQKEIKFALDIADEKPEGTIFIIPLKLEECSVPMRLSEWQWVNYFEKEGYRKLLLALRKRAQNLGINVM